VRPSVCRMVHYVSYGTPGGEYRQACRAAVITEVIESAELEPSISLAVLNPEGMFFNRGVSYHEGEPLKPGESRRDLCGNRNYAGGTWHWPARDPEAAL
jgi:hypothetical protein